MSKGLGKFQRLMIETAAATKTIWDIKPDGIEIEVADTHAKTALGITLKQRGGYTWKKTGEPWFESTLHVANREEYMEAKAAFKSTSFRIHKSAVELLPCLWSTNNLRATLFPELWPKDDAREYRIGSRGYEVAMIPEEIRAPRNAAKVRMSKALKSMEKRGILEYAGFLSPSRGDEAETIINEHWNAYYVTGNILIPTEKISPFHIVFAVLDPQGLVKR